MKNWIHLAILFAISVSVHCGSVTGAEIAPKLVITAPKPVRLIATNGIMEVVGTTSSTITVTNVYCQVNDTNWLATSSSNQFKNWKLTMPVTPGTNVLRAYAISSTGKCSTTNAVTFFKIIKASLILVTNGNGTITKVDFAGNPLEIGRAYSVKANSGAGYVFESWTGIYANRTNTSANPSMMFMMESNLVIQANFVTNPFPSYVGDYSGLFRPEWDNVRTENSGRFNVAVTVKGTYSGKLILQGETYSFSGFFQPVIGDSSQAGFTQTVAVSGKKSIFIQFWPQPLSKTIYGWVYDQSGQLAAVIWAFWVNNSNGNHFAGNYTMNIQGSIYDAFPDPAALPTGEGSAAISVSSTGVASIRGILADGTAFTQTTPIQRQGDFPIYASLYGGKGLLMQWSSFSNQVYLQTSEVALPGGGTVTNVTTNMNYRIVTWAKMQGAVGKNFTGGFDDYRAMALSRYVPPATGKAPVEWANGVLVVGDGNLPARYTNTLYVTNGLLKVGAGGLTNVTLTVARDGTFKGSFKVPGLKTLNSFSGALIQNCPTNMQTFGGGYFMGTNQSGYVKILPR